MLEIMRNQAQSWIAKVILGGIALSFGLWGIGDYFRGDHVSYVAEVDGKGITDTDFAQNYERQLNNYRALLGAQFSKKLVAQMGLKNTTLQTMINRQLMLDEASRMGLVGSDAALLAYVQSNPSFQEAGVFNPQRYQALTRNLGFRTTRDYENDARVNLMIDALQKTIVDSAQVSDEEIRAQFEREYAKRTIAAVMIDPQSLVKSITIDDAAARAWYDTHKQGYKSKLKVKVAAVEIDPKKIAQDQGMAMEKARDEAYNLSQDLDNALGMEDSLQAAAKSLGLSIHETDLMDSNQALADKLIGSDNLLRNQAFTAKSGDTINILELDDGRFVAIEVLQRVEPEILAFKDVAATVYEDARNQAAMDKANNIAKDLLAHASSASPDAIAQKGGYAKFLSKPVRRNGMGDDASWLTPSIVDAAFHTPNQHWAKQAIVTSHGLALVYVAKTMAGDDATFEKQKDAIRLEAAKAKGAVRFARWMATVRDRHDIVVHNKVLAQF